jgi:hypothetical protein
MIEIVGIFFLLVLILRLHSCSLPLIPSLKWKDSIKGFNVFICRIGHNFFNKVEKLEEVKKKTVKAEINEDSTQTENCEKEVIEKKLGKTAKKHTISFLLKCFCLIF